MTATMANRCARHWYTYYGFPGSSAPTCRRCPELNPRYDRDRDPYAGPREDSNLQPFDNHSDPS